MFIDADSKKQKVARKGAQFCVRRATERERGAPFSSSPLRKYTLVIDPSRSTSGSFVQSFLRYGPNMRKVDLSDSFDA